MRKRIVLPRMTCGKCKHAWFPRTEDVRICPKCKSVRWDQGEPRKEGKVK